MNLTQEQLQGLLEEILKSADSNSNEASIVARHLVQANLRGHDSHGAYIVNYYLDCLRDGALAPNAELTTISDNGAVLLFDGNNGYGQRMAHEAMEKAIARCKESGVAIMGLRNSHHTGRAGTYAEQAAAAGLISMNYINALEFPPRVAPIGGKKATLMTNPIAFGLPREDNEDLIMDFATSAVAFGKVEIARNKGAQLPPGSIVDGDGKPTNDPATLYGDNPGAILPFGAHKGYGLLLFCELLAGALTGGATARTISSELKGTTNNLLSVLINPTYLAGSAFTREAESFIQFVTDTEPADPEFPVILPGDMELNTRTIRTENGIPFDSNSWAEIAQAAERVGVTLNL